jgi:hypothetical protein
VPDDGAVGQQLDLREDAGMEAQPSHPLAATDKSQDEGLQRLLGCRDQEVVGRR